MDRLTDPWMGARYIVHQGRRVYMTAGQIARLTGLRFRPLVRTP